MVSVRQALLSAAVLGTVCSAAEEASTAMLHITSAGVTVMGDDVTALVGHDRRDGESRLEWLGRLDDWQAAGSTAAVEADRLLLWCGGSDGSFELTFPNPRYVRFEGQVVVQESGVQRVALPSEFLTSAYTCRMGEYDNVFQRVQQGARRLGRELGTAGAVPRTERRVGPSSSVHNIVVLAAGYTNAERSLWETDLAEVMRAFTDPPGDDYEQTNPMLRYQPLVNVFSVWQPSPQSGADNMRRSGINVNDNLGCGYSPSMDRLITCDRALMLDLAETTDAKPKSVNLRNVVALVIVNSDVYGGSGSGGSGFKVGVFYGRGRDRATFASIMYHELGHSWLGLADEYSYGGNGPATGSEKNCISPSLVNNPPWAHLISAGKVPARPTLSCTHDNWYRATPTCLMLALETERLCPVCQEAGSLQLYDTPTFSNTFPLCPLPDETVLVEAGGEVRLHANSLFVARGGVRLLWELLQVGSSSVRETLCQGSAACTDVVVRGSSLVLGQINTVRLTVFDESPMVVRRSAKMTQTVTFKLRAVTQIDRQASGVRARKCYCSNERQFDCRGGASFFSNRGASDVPYYSECTSGFCELHTTAYERDGPGGVPSTAVPVPAVPRTTTPSTSVPSTAVPAVPSTSVPSTVPRTSSPSTGGGGSFPAVCSGAVTQTLTGTTGVLRHPASGTEYANNDKRCWSIACGATAKVSLKWKAFVTEQGYDFVDLYEGAATASRWHTSGKTLPAPETLGGAAPAVVVFQSDQSVVGSGFEVEWTCEGDRPAVQPAFCKSMTTVSGVSGAITYPTQGGSYGNNEAVCWRIACAGAVSITFTRLRTETNYDFVSVHSYQTTGATSQQLRTSGTTVPPAQQVQGDALVFFQSDYSVADTGFSLSYTCR